MNPPAGAHTREPEARAGGRPWAGAWSLLPAAALGLVSLPYLYRDCVGDPDMLLMLNGVIEHPAAAHQWNPSHKYGLLFSWGYYWLLYHLPGQVREHPSQLIAAVNVIGWLSAVLACGALGLLALRLYGLGRSLALTIPLAFSPMVLELATYGHPFMLSVALMFGGAIVLFHAESQAGVASLAGRALAALLVFASLAVRAESLLVLPWLALVSSHERAAPLSIRRAMERAFVFVVAFLAFLWVQRGIGSGPGLVFDTLSAFFRSFYHPGQLLRGLVVLGLGLGLALLAAAAALTLWGWARRDPVRATVPSLVLLGVSLLFWLPNPTPCRHFFFALLAVCELFALGAVRRLGTRRAVVLALTVVVLNQVGAELLYRPITRQYWASETGSRRLATGSVPLGASLPYHAAMQSVHGGLRDEGRRLARVPDREVIFFGDAGDYVILALLERGGLSTWVDTLEAGFWAARIDRAGQTYHIVRPRDVAAEYLAVDPFPHARVYMQPSTRSHLDRAPIPPERLLTLP